MPQKYNLPSTVIVLFLILCFVYFYVDFGAEDTDKIFITITTFFFSIFTGFFITRQGSRYSKIREIISTYDGKMSGMFRASQNISAKVNARISEVILAHYNKIIETRQWDYHFVNKSTTISSIHKILEEEIGDAKQETLRNQSVGRVLTLASDLQVLRKNMVMLSQERIPQFQWLLIFFFLFILIATVSILPSHGFVLGSVLKAAFAVSIVSVVLILRNLDNLHLFEEFIGENSAKDVVNTIEGTK